MTFRKHAAAAKTVNGKSSASSGRLRDARIRIRAVRRNVLHYRLPTRGRYINRRRGDQVRAVGGRRDVVGVYERYNTSCTPQWVPLVIGHSRVGQAFSRSYWLNRLSPFGPDDLHHGQTTKRNRSIFNKIRFRSRRPKKTQNENITRSDRFRGE